MSASLSYDHRLSVPTWVERLTGQIGADEFGSELISALSELTDAEDCAAFHYGPEGVTTIAVGSLRNVDNTRLAADRYEQGLWKRDRFLLRHRVGSPQGRRPDIYAISTRDIRDEQFRWNCYEFQDVNMQVSIRRHTPAGTISLSAFKGRKARFRDGELTRLRDMGSLLLTFVSRHCELHARPSSSVPTRLSLAMAHRLVRGLGRGLSRREIEVCAHLVEGKSMEGIALELGLSRHSVVTYKRRAFNRLRIATKTELSSLCISSLIGAAK